jgi:hypothetical protein
MSDNRSPPVPSGQVDQNHNAFQASMVQSSYEEDVFPHSRNSPPCNPPSPQQGDLLPIFEDEEETARCGHNYSFQETGLEFLQPGPSFLPGPEGDLEILAISPGQQVALFLQTSHQNCDDPVGQSLAQMVVSPSESNFATSRFYEPEDKDVPIRRSTHNTTNKAGKVKAGKSKSGKLTNKVHSLKEKIKSEIANQFSILSEAHENEIELSSHHQPSDKDRLAEIVNTRLKCRTKIDECLKVLEELGEVQDKFMK